MGAPLNRIAIIGGGPAGLRAAEIAAQQGASVTLYEAKPSVGRKFLVAGRGGLNITKDEPPDIFAQRYEGPGASPAWWRQLIGEFSPDDLRAWANELGIETFAASTGRVYPREMKAAPLLRRWVQRLKTSGVEFHMHHRWTGAQRSDKWQLTFETPEGQVTTNADAVIFALGGGSWPQTGSDGGWIAAFAALGIATSPLEPANCGWEVDWSAEVLAVEGQPLKNVAVHAGDRSARAELIVTQYGLEGGALYQVGAALRAMPSPEIRIDFKPDVPVERLVAKMGPARRHLLQEAAQRWKLPPAVQAILNSHPDAPGWDTPQKVAEAVKACRVPLTQPRPIAEAISSAGGVHWTELSDDLMVKRHPGLFVAGEMIDWEAPTGGYLMQGCFASGKRASEGAWKWLQTAV